jgi:superfamily I DNA/RNA helicase
MTMHGSKGLEAEYVYVIGVALHIIPNKKALNDAYEISEDKYMKLIEEERRLLYVSMTRAENNLYMSTVLGDEKNPNKYGYCELLPPGFYQKYEVAVLSTHEQS